MPRGTPFNTKDKWTDLYKKTQKELIIYGTEDIILDDNNNFSKTVITAKTAAGDEYTDQYSTGAVESFTVYAQGTGTWEVQVSPDPNTGIWLPYATATTNSGFVSVTSYHPWMRVKVSDTASLIIYLANKYATY